MQDTHAAARVQSLDALVAILARLRQRGRTVVFTNGCFDILHIGHVTLLEQSAEFGDVLVVGVNSDASVRRIKGPNRPVIPQDQRARLVSALRPVDYVVFFDEDTPQLLIEKILPDVLIKGEDYREEDIVGRDVVLARGGRVIRLPLVAGLSTSVILRRAQDPSAPRG